MTGVYIQNALMHFSFQTSLPTIILNNIVKQRLKHIIFISMTFTTQTFQYLFSYGSFLYYRNCNLIHENRNTKKFRRFCVGYNTLR